MGIGFDFIKNKAVMDSWVIAKHMSYSERRSKSSTNENITNVTDIVFENRHTNVREIAVKINKSRISSHWHLFDLSPIFFINNISNIIVDHVTAVSTFSNPKSLEGRNSKNWKIKVAGQTSGQWGVLILPELFTCDSIKIFSGELGFIGLIFKILAKKCRPDQKFL